MCHRVFRTPQQACGVDICTCVTSTGGECNADDTTNRRKLIARQWRGIGHNGVHRPRTAAARAHHRQQQQQSGRRRLLDDGIPETSVTTMLQMTFKTDATGTGSSKAAAAFAQFSECREEGFTIMKSDWFDNVEMGGFNFSQILTNKNLNSDKSSVVLLRDPADVLAQSVTYPDEKSGSSIMRWLWFIIFMIALVMSLALCWCLGLLSVRDAKLDDGASDDGNMVIVDDLPRKKQDTNFQFENKRMYDKQPQPGRSPSPARLGNMHKVGSNNFTGVYTADSDDDEEFSSTNTGNNGAGGSANSPNKKNKKKGKGKSKSATAKQVEFDDLDFDATGKVIEEGDERAVAESGDWRKDLW
jgi:hypothetical protein